jgi:hypothetical protein
MEGRSIQVQNKEGGQVLVRGGVGGGEVGAGLGQGRCRRRRRASKAAATAAISPSILAAGVNALTEPKAAASRIESGAGIGGQLRGTKRLNPHYIGGVVCTRVQEVLW